MQTFLRVGRANLWISRAVDPPFDGSSFDVCADVDELCDKVLRGNWYLGQTFVLGDLCFVGQVDSGGEWLVTKGQIAFEPLTMQTGVEGRELAEQRLRALVARFEAASEEPGKRLKYRGAADTYQVEPFLSALAHVGDGLARPKVTRARSTKKTDLFSVFPLAPVISCRVTRTKRLAAGSGRPWLVGGMGR